MQGFLRCGLFVGAADDVKGSGGKGRKAKRGRGRRWRGGYIHHEADGSRLFIIERQVSGERFHLSTRCHDEDAAMVQLARFESNPRGYDPAGEEPDAPLLLSNELLESFLHWQLDVKGNTSKHACSMVRFLGDWMAELRGKDLRTLSLRVDVKPALARWKKSVPHRIIALKAFFSYLRKELLVLRHAEDCTLDLPVPQAQAEKNRRRKVANWETVVDVYARLEQRDQDILQLAVATGWHLSELQRFIRAPESAIEVPTGSLTAGALPVLAVLRTWHKSKTWTRTSLVHQRHVDAARRLKEAGQWVNETRLREALYSALEAADAKRRELDPNHQDRPRFSLGVMRHSVATWGIELGATVAEAAEALDHRDPRTTERFYADVMVPRAPLPTRELGGDVTVN